MDLEQKAIERIKTASEMSIHHYKQPLVCTYSGGKDSDVMLELFKRSDIPFEVHNSHTTVDAPPTVYHIRKKFRELELQGVKAIIEMPTYRGKRTTMWTLIPDKLMPPSRLMRYCCSVLKETGCANRFIATGVRWDESNARKEREAYEAIASSKKNKVTASDEIMLMNDNSEKRKLTEHCMKKTRWLSIQSLIGHIRIYGNLFIRNTLNITNYMSADIVGLGVSDVLWLARDDGKSLQTFRLIRGHTSGHLIRCWNG